MSTASARPLDYQPAPEAHAPGAAPSRARPWVLVIAAALVLWYWVRPRLIWILASSNPGQTAFFIFRYDQDELLLAAAAVGAWFVVCRLNRGKSRRLSYLAVFAALAAVLNPLLVEHLLRVLHLRTVGRGDSEMQSFRTAALAFVTGVVAAVRIARNRETLWGLPFAGVGVALGVLVVVAWVALVIALVSGMSGH
jgi:hypothetical protein